LAQRLYIVESRIYFISNYIEESNSRNFKRDIRNLIIIKNLFQLSLDNIEHSCYISGHLPESMCQLEEDEEDKEDL